MLQTVWSFSFWLCWIKEIWPSWSAPIVGTNPIVPPCSRKVSIWIFNSFLLLNTFKLFVFCKKVREVILGLRSRSFLFINRNSATWFPKHNRIGKADQPGSDQRVSCRWNGVIAAAFNNHFFIFVCREVQCIDDFRPFVPDVFSFIHIEDIVNDGTGIC